MSTLHKMLMPSFPILLCPIINKIVIVGTEIQAGCAAPLPLREFGDALDSQTRIALLNHDALRRLIDMTMLLCELCCSVSTNGAISLSTLGNEYSSLSIMALTILALFVAEY